MIFDEYKKTPQGHVANISQAITFVFKQLRKICTNIQAQRSMKRLEYGFCNKIVQLPLSYGEERHCNKKYYTTRNLLIHDGFSVTDLHTVTNRRNP